MYPVKNTPPKWCRSDEDIIGSDMTLLTTSKLKVKAFHVSFIFGRFYGLMLHLKVCTFSFSELLTWINGKFDCIVKAWKVNEVIGNQVQVFLTSSTKIPVTFGARN